jgi:hypothetical protein
VARVVPMRIKRWRWVVGGGLSASAALACAVWLYSTRTAITEDNAVRIKPGMTLAEVEAILGGPARLESTGPLAAELPWEDGDDDASHELREAVAPMWFRDGPGGPRRLAWTNIPGVRRPEPRARFWESNQEQIRVEFDEDGRVVRCEWQAVRRVYDHRLDPVRGWLGL